MRNVKESSREGGFFRHAHVKGLFVYMYFWRSLELDVVEEP